MQFEMLFRELIKNARSATANRPNGSIVICGRIAKALFVGGPRLEMEIIDNGIGMTEDVSRKAVTTFFSTKAGAHLGLGLSICSQLISNLKGTLQIESRAGMGTTVRFSVPVAMLRNCQLSPDAADRELTVR
jgi:signal transduction histidine kinase